MTRRLRWITALVLVALIALFAARGWVIVEETEYAVVTDFGRIVAVHGAQPGLHAKWPWQSVETIDRRLQVFDPPPREMITGDKRNLEVSSYVVWRVGDAVRFLRSAATLEAAEARLNERVTAALSHAVGSRDLRDSLRWTRLSGSWTG